MTPSAAPIGRLSVCPTPIGNLEDVTLRVLERLREADVIACEDTRHTARLLERHAIRAKRLLSFHEHNERARGAELVERVRAGERVALVSDAGMPLVSDPGHVLLTAAIEAGIEPEVLPGPSAVLTALLASGLPADSWRFVGFLPRRRGELERLLAEQTQTETLVAFESPKRIAKTLSLLAETDPERAGAVCRELTKLHEEVVRGSVAELAERFAQTPARGEVVLVLAPRTASRGELDLTDALAALRELVAAGAKPRPAASALARLCGLSANELYRGLTDDSDSSLRDG
ncbi:MAG TPA: 16S rRNA (cytidine(1402)-2'-O)-methyltransferase [Solirubrobacteraceae bacterium]|jgi:16S rRNA (cytidine1402-2'-O)-methyltransferase